MLTIKVQYEILAINIEKLYAKQFDLNDPVIEKHCEYIASFIKAAGWTEEEYMDRWMQEQEKINPILPVRNQNCN